MRGFLRTVAFVTAAAAGPIAAQQVQPPSNRRPVMVQEPPDYVGEPEDLESLVQVSDVILHGRIVGSRPFLDGYRLVHTEHTVKVDQVLKGNPATIGPTVRFLQDAGEMDAGDVIIRVRNQPLQLGSDYILFLKWARGMNAYVLSFGEGYTFNTAGGLAEATKPSTVGKRVNGMSATDLMTWVKSLAANK